MSDAPNASNDDAAAPEVELDSLIRRMQDRIKKKTSGNTTQSGLDLASELVKLDKKAREVEATLTKERDAYSVRCRDMEEKLRRLEPWLKQLKGEFQRAQTERDALRDQLTATQTTAVKPSSAASEAQLKIALADVETARAARDAAVAETESLRTKLVAAQGAARSGSEQRAAGAEPARDASAEEIAKLRKIAVENRRSDDEVRGLKKQIEQLETTTSAHKAVARAAQEAAETLQTRITEMEKTAQRKAEAAQRENRSSPDLTRQLDEARAQAAAAKAELAAAVSTSAALKGGEQGVRRELAEKSQTLTTVLAELAEAKRVAERLRSDAAEIERRAESACAASAESRSLEAETDRRAAQASAEAARLTVALESADAELKAAREEAAAARLEAAEQRELCEEAMKAEMTARGAAEERVRAVAAAEKRSQDNEVRASRAESRVAELESEIELVRNQSQSFATEAASLSGAIEAERQNSTKRLESAETSWRSQMRAAESRFESELHRERERGREAEEMLRVRDERNTRTRLDLESDASRVRNAAMQFVAAKAQEIVAGLQRIVGEEPQVVPPITATMDVDQSVRTPTATVVVPQPVSGGWDKLISDVEQLWTEVEGMSAGGAAPLRDTDSLTAEQAAEAAMAIAARPPAAAAAAVRSTEPKTVGVEDATAAELARPKKRRR